MEPVLIFEGVYIFNDRVVAREYEDFVYFLDKDGNWYCFLIKHHTMVEPIAEIIPILKEIEEMWKKDKMKEKLND